MKTTSEIIYQSRMYMFSIKRLVVACSSSSSSIATQSLPPLLLSLFLINLVSRHKSQSLHLVHKRTRWWWWWWWCRSGRWSTLRFPRPPASQHVPADTYTRTYHQQAMRHFAAIKNLIGQLCGESWNKFTFPLYKAIWCCFFLPPSFIFRYHSLSTIFC